MNLVGYSAFAFKTFCQLGIISSLALVSGVVAEYFDFSEEGQSLKAMGAVGLMETGYSLFTYSLFTPTLSSINKTKESELSSGDPSGMFPI